MKYRHFIILRNSILGALGIGACVGAYYLLSGPDKSSNTDLPTQVSSETQELNLEQDEVSQYRLTTGPEITAAHREIMDMQKSASLAEGKPDPNNNGVKMFKKMPTYQLDFRCDKEKGFDYFNRVKIDWDYDKNWDEKWDFRENGMVKRQCSTSDDNSTYDLVQETIDGKWEQVGKATGDTTAVDGKSLNSKQEEVRNLQKNTPLSDGKHDPNNNGLKHYLKQPGYFVDLRCDKEKGFDYWNRVKIDWDKDKNWDEKWDVRKDGSIKRQFSSKDDNNYDVVEELK